MNDSQKCFYERANIYDNEYNQNMNVVKKIYLWKYNAYSNESYDIYFAKMKFLIPFFMNEFKFVNKLK